MTKEPVFPLDFPFQRVLASEQNSSVTFMVAAMLTESYMHHGERLAASCSKFGIPFVIYVVPTVHNSISRHGTPDPRFTKANFIHFLLDTYQKSIAYLDADCYFEEYPVLFEQLVREQCDFAIYNLLADEDNCAYRPVPMKITVDGKQLLTHRFYIFSHSINLYAPQQLFCCGATQFYRHSEAAIRLLRGWHETIAMFPGSADDECLDFTYNKRLRGDSCLKAVWLPKSYARYAWWIQAKPVINHPDFPFQYSGHQFIGIGDDRFWREETKPYEPATLIPSGALLNIETGDVCVRDEEARKLRIIGRVEQPLWR